MEKKKLEKTHIKNVTQFVYKSSVIWLFIFCSFSSQLSAQSLEEYNTKAREVMLDSETFLFAEGKCYDTSLSAKHQQVKAQNDITEELKYMIAEEYYASGVSAKKLQFDIGKQTSIFSIISYTDDTGVKMMCYLNKKTTSCKKNESDGMFSVVETSGNTTKKVFKRNNKDSENAPLASTSKKTDQTTKEVNSPTPKDIIEKDNVTKNQDPKPIISPTTKRPETTFEKLDFSNITFDVEILNSVAKLGMFSKIVSFLKKETYTSQGAIKIGNINTLDSPESVYILQFNKSGQLLNILDKEGDVSKKSLVNDKTVNYKESKLPLMWLYITEQ